MSEESNIFSIKAQKTKYSKFGINLERLFHKNSLECLQFKLKHPRYFKSKDERVDDLTSKNKSLLNLNKLTIDLVGSTHSMPSKYNNTVSENYLKGGIKAKVSGNLNLSSKMKNDKMINKKNPDFIEAEPDRELTLKELLQQERDKK